MKPNITCKHQTQIGYDIHSQPIYGNVKSLKCLVVRYKSTAQKTTVRADSSASRGRNQEAVYDTIILFEPSSAVKKDDLIEIFGEKLRINSLEYRFKINGEIDHFECGLNIWE